MCQCFLINTMQVNGVQCCFGSYWFSSVFLGSTEESKSYMFGTTWGRFFLLFNFIRNAQINQHTYKVTWVPFTRAVPNLTPPCGEAGALATYLLYHRPPLRLLSLWCNWEWGYGNVPAQQCPTAVAESMTIHAAQQAWGPIQHPAMEESGVRWTKTQPNLKR